jgi:hypothetical protein
MGREAEPEEDSLKAAYERCSALLDIYIKKYEDLEELVKQNSLMVEELRKGVDDLTIATEGLVAVWTTANNVQKFIKWVSSIGFLGILVTWVISKIPSDWFP